MYNFSFSDVYAQLPNTEMKWVVLMAAIEYGVSGFLDQILKVDNGPKTWLMDRLLSRVFTNTHFPGRLRKLSTLVRHGAEITTKVRRIIAHVGSPCMHARVGLWPFRCSKNSLRTQRR